MKTLFLMRHAKSDWADSSQSDFDRPLNRRGCSDAPRMGAVLGSGNALVDFVLCSPAARARETAELVVESNHDSPPPVLHFDDRLYLANPATLSSVVCSAPDTCDSVLVIAHNPGMEEWLADLSGCQVKFSTAALARVQLDIGRWTDISEHCGQLQWFVTPRLLKAVVAD